MSDIRDELAEIDPELLLMDGFDDCILGICESFGGVPVVAYDYDKVLASLQASGMTYEEAVEYHEFNQAGAYVGERTPVFIRRVES
jgi:hypothetical protein